jgi:hypothetical protein
MKRISMVALCIAAVFAFAATTAMADDGDTGYLPTFKVCIKAAKSGKTYTGKFNDKACTEANAKSEGKYELASWEHAKKKAFKSSSGKSTLYSYIPKVGIAGTVTCSKDKGAGEITGKDDATATVTFEKCESSGFKCTSPGAKAGDIKTNTLYEELVWLNPPTDTEVGVVVEAAGGGVSAEFNCEEHLKVKTVGSLVGKITGDVGAISKDLTETFTVNKTTGEQEPGEAEGEPHSLYSEIESEAFTGTLPSGEETADLAKGEALGIFGAEEAGD